MSFNSCSYNLVSYNQNCSVRNNTNIIPEDTRSLPSGGIGTLTQKDATFLNSIERNSKARQIQYLLSLHNIDTEGDGEERDIQDWATKPDEYVAITINFNNKITRFDAVIPGFEADIDVEIQDLEENTVSFEITDLKRD